jgi:hypothetical protein
MTSEGPKNGSTFVNEATVGTVNWVNPGYAVTSNDVRATASLNNTISKYLKATGFGFTIPGGATIRGILVEVERSKTGSGAVHDQNIKIVKGNSIAGGDHFGPNDYPLTTDAYESYGGSTDLWSLSWTPSDINAADFGVAISAYEYISVAASARIDHIRITVYYQEYFFRKKEISQLPHYRM